MITRDEAIKLLRGGIEGILEWNRRRKAGEEIPNLSDAQLIGVDLTGADLFSANLSDANLFDANLNDANLDNAILINANLCRAYLGGASLIHANLSNAILNSTELSRATLVNANLSGAKFYAAMVFDANLCDANLSEASLVNSAFHGLLVSEKTNFTGATFGFTVANFDSSITKGMNEINHIAPSSVDVSTIVRFQSELPETFLRGCGIREEEIEYFRQLKNALSPIRFYSCFISYSSTDEEFATRLHNDFQAAGIRCWKWTHDARTGKNIWGEIDTAIRVFDKLVLIASESSLKSPEVQDEIERAIQKEKQLRREKESGKYDGDVDVLFPVRVDDFVIEGWQHERKADVTKKVIADARGWEKDNDKYQAVMKRLIRDLKDAPEVT